MNDRKAMQQALEALEMLSQQPIEMALDYADNAIEVLRERLAQPEQEPVCAHGIGKTKCSFCHQPQPEQEPVAYVTHGELADYMDKIADAIAYNSHEQLNALAYRLREKNT